MLTRQQTISSHRIPVNPSEATSLAHPAAFRNMVQHGNHLLISQLGTKEQGPLSLRETCFAGVAIEQAQMIVLTIAHADGQVARATFGMGQAT